MKHRFVHLDLLRGSAALLVCISHLCAFLFIPLKQIVKPGYLEMAFYFGAPLGHQAVTLFFVLSGFLVGGSVIKLYLLRRWSWKDYMMKRLTRLWVVLLPALLLTLFWDTLGESISKAGYQGAFFHIYRSGPNLNSPVDHGLTEFCGNICFLQTIIVHVYGSNGPLWSISNEFWYYILFPVLLAIFVSSNVIAKLTYLLLSVILVTFLPSQLLSQGLAWVLGAGIFYCLQKEQFFKAVVHPIFLMASILLTLIIVTMSRVGKLGGMFDVALAVSFTPLVAALAVRKARVGLYSRLCAAASDFSYTLYLVHFPVMAFIFFSFFRGRQMLLGPAGFGMFSGMLAIIILYAALIWWCFERNTDRVRSFIEKHFMLHPSASGKS